MQTVRSLLYGGFLWTEDPLDREETPGQRPSFTENPLWTETHPLDRDQPPCEQNDTQV